MKFYDEIHPPCLEIDASVIRPRAAILQTRIDTSCPRDKAPDNIILRPITFASKSLSSAERRYRCTQREALGIQQGIEKFHLYCFMQEVSIITDHNLLITIFKKDVAMLSQKMQRFLLRINQYRVRIIYKPGPDLFIADWLSRQNHKEKGLKNPWHAIQCW